ncbi:MAG: hypothetical protein FWE31_05910 [Firmicutes bacterium]|nr:hypothetical protein [Bacillota bacterium]
MGKGIENLIVSSRIRLARNLEGVPFKPTSVDAFEDLAQTIKSNNEGFASVRIDQLDQQVATALFEQHLISREILGNKKNGMLVTRDRACVMLGEEDHVRIQVIEVGLNIQKAFMLARKIATDIETEHKIAHDEKLGFLTSCPTNLGTGMRASVMLFLPALSLTGRIMQIVNELKGHKIVVRGVYGEGSEASGYMYQISNQACLQMGEEAILKKVEEITTQICNIELNLQKELIEKNRDDITDQVMRAFGLLSHAHKISSDEATENLAWLKLGDCLGLLKFKPRILDDLFFVIKPATLTSQNEKASNILTRDIMRATKIKEVLRSARQK